MGDTARKVNSGEVIYLKKEDDRIAEDSELSVRRTLNKREIRRSTFYSWNRRDLEVGVEGRALKSPGSEPSGTKFRMK